MSRNIRWDLITIVVAALSVIVSVFIVINERITKLDNRVVDLMQRVSVLETSCLPPGDVRIIEQLHQMREDGKH